MMSNLEKHENGGMMGMFDFFEEYLAGRKFYVAKCRFCGAKYYEKRRRDLKKTIQSHSCGAIGNHELWIHCGELHHFNRAYRDHGVPYSAKRCVACGCDKPELSEEL